MTLNCSSATTATMTDHETPLLKHRNSLREMGEFAYKEGARLADNPFFTEPFEETAPLAHPLTDGEAREAWAEGWLYQRTQYPSAADVAKDAMESDPDMERLSP